MVKRTTSFYIGDVLIFVVLLEYTHCLSVWSRSHCLWNSNIPVAEKHTHTHLQCLETFFEMGYCYSIYVDLLLMFRWFITILIWISILNGWTRSDVLRPSSHSCSVHACVCVCAYANSRILFYIEFPFSFFLHIQLYIHDTYNIQIPSLSHSPPLLTISASLRTREWEYFVFSKQARDVICFELYFISFMISVYLHPVA